jgi:hypothetical protein
MVLHHDKWNLELKTCCMNLSSVLCVYLELIIRLKCVVDWIVIVCVLSQDALVQFDQDANPTSLARRSADLQRWLAENESQAAAGAESDSKTIDMDALMMPKDALSKQYVGWIIINLQCGIG